MNKKLALAALTLALAVGGAVGVFSATAEDQSPSPATGPTTTSTTTSGDTTTPGDDGGSGRDHPEDDGVAEPGEDVSGPCDEAEHANDPRCAGTAAAVDDGGVDDSGHGGIDDRGGDDDGSSHGSDDDDG